MTNIVCRLTPTYKLIYFIYNFRMNLETLFFDDNRWQYHEESIHDKNEIDLVLVFGDSDVFKQSEHYDYLRSLYPNADIVGASSAGNVMGAEVSPYPLVATAVKFDNASVKVSFIDFNPEDDLKKASGELLEQLPKEGLKNIFILSDGLHVNGSELALGMNEVSPSTLITGGLAGDGSRFKHTYVVANDTPKEYRIAAIGFYGDSLSISSGCFSGWQEFGSDYVITRSQGNIVYEIDNKPALQLYKKYLGEYADQLPHSGLRFPLSIKQEGQSEEVIRSMVAADETEESLTFAGAVPQGCQAKLMRTNMDGLIDGAHNAANAITQKNKKTALGLVVSCVARKLVLKQLTDDELEAIESVLGTEVHLSGFYSYGELAPFNNTTNICHLHNQTMTLTVIYED